jgi:hypothetical protein
MARYRRVELASGQKGYARMVPFSYTLVVNPLAAAVAAGASVTGTLQVDPGLPFVLTEMGCAIDADTPTLTTLSQWGFTILDGESQQLLCNGETPRERMFGTRDFPRQLPNEVDISPADQLTVTATNRNAGAVSSRINVVFNGFKLVGFTPSNPE